jgi:putative ABC transport system ATP-binding protein
MKIELRDVALEYDVGAPLFQRVSLLIEPGQFLLIEGPSGSGKSSLLRLLNRLQEPTAGEILVDDKPLSLHDVVALRRSIGYLQQTPVMVEGSVADNLALPFQFAASGAARAPGAAAMRQLLAEFLLEGVDPESDAPRLSVGQKQRVALIRMLLMQPKVLLCDEPTSALDPQSRDIVQESLERLNIEQQMTVVVVTHLAFEPQQVNPRRYRLTRQDGFQLVAP